MTDNGFIPVDFTASYTGGFPGSTLPPLHRIQQLPRPHRPTIHHPINRRERQRDRRRPLDRERLAVAYARRPFGVARGGGVEASGDLVRQLDRGVVDLGGAGGGAEGVVFHKPPRARWGVGRGGLVGVNPFIDFAQTTKQGLPAADPVGGEVFAPVAVADPLKPFGAVLKQRLGLIGPLRRVLGINAVR